jgi:hypothetical protein
MIGWLLRLFGIGRPKQSPSAASNRAAAQAARAKLPPAQSLPPELFKAERRRVIAYVARARVPIRQAATARQLWIADLSKVYEAIRTSPTQLILEKAGEVGFKHEPAFRDALMLAQSIEPPPSCEAVHAGLIGWLTSLHAACLSLIDARRLKDRSLLGNFREHLSQARRHAAVLAGERAKLFVDYQLKVRPTISRRRPRVAGEEGAEGATTDQDGADETRASAPPASQPRRGGAGGTKRTGTRVSATRPPRVRAASGAKPPPRRRTG